MLLILLACSALASDRRLRLNAGTERFTLSQTKAMVSLPDLATRLHRRATYVTQFVLAVWEVPSRSCFGGLARSVTVFSCHIRTINILQTP